MGRISHRRLVLHHMRIYFVRASAPRAPTSARDANFPTCSAFSTLHSLRLRSIFATMSREIRPTSFSSVGWKEALGPT